MSDIRYSRHARLRMVERGTSEREVERAISKGAKRMQDDKIICAYRQIEVVAKRTKDAWYVITVMPRW